MRNRRMTLLLTAALGYLIWGAAPVLAGSSRGQGGHHDDEYSDHHSYHSHKPKHHHHDDEYSDRRHARYGHARFAVPRHLPGPIVHDYRNYYHGRLYFKPHGHHHETYYFPVVTEFGYSYRPHSYCGGELYLAGSYVSLRLNF